MAHSSQTSGKILVFVALWAGLFAFVVSAVQAMRGLAGFFAGFVLAGLFSCGIFLIVRNVLTRRLLSLVQYTSLRFDETDPPAVPARKKKGAALPDELDLLAAAVNALRARSLRNLAGKKAAIASRNRQRALLSALTNSSRDLIYYKDSRGLYRGCNAAFEECVGRSSRDLAGLTDFDLFPHDIAESFCAHDQEALAIGRPCRKEQWLHYPDGRRVLLDTCKTVYRDRNGEILGLAGISRDCTGSRRGEDALHAAQEQAEIAFNAGPLLIMIVDTRLERIIDVNRPFLEKTHYRKQELVGRAMVDSGLWGADEDRQRLVRIFEDVGSVDDFAVRIRKKPGEEMSCLLSGRKGRFSETECIWMFLQDVSERERADRELRAGERRFRDFASTAADWFWEMDADLHFTYLTGEVEEVIGMAIEKIIGASWEQLLLGHGRINASEYRANYDALSRRAPFSGFEVDWPRPDGGQRRIVLNGKPVFDAAGSFAGYRGAGRDVTHRKEAEEAMRRSMKMDAVGQVTGGIAHDFNNILGIIIGNLDYIKHFGNVDEMTLDRVEAAAKAAERASTLTRQLLDFSGRQARICQPTDINALIRDMESLIARSVTPEVEVVTELAPDLWMIDIDRGDFADVLLNLVLNARDAMPAGGRLQIKTGNIVLDAYYTAMNPGLDKGDYVLLAVNDAGVGIQPEVLEHIFEPFFTTKPPGKGTGLGMSMVYAFAQRSKGSVRVYSEPGVGTVVHLYLPRTTEAIHEQAQPLRVKPGLPGGKETILLVDDETDLLALSADMLKILGYTTLTATNGNEAMAVLLEKGGAVDLLFTDVVMPGGMNGFELAEQALLLNPELKILFTSGYIEKAVPKIGQFSFAPQMLIKPYNHVDLAVKIDEVLHGEIMGRMEQI